MIINCQVFIDRISATSVYYLIIQLLVMFSLSRLLLATKAKWLKLNNLVCKLKNICTEATFTHQNSERSRRLGKRQQSNQQIIHCLKKRSCLILWTLWTHCVGPTHSAFSANYCHVLLWINWTSNRFAYCFSSFTSRILLLCAEHASNLPWLPNAKECLDCVQPPTIVK